MPCNFSLTADLNVACSVSLTDDFNVPTPPGKWEIPGNIVLHVPGREMSLKIKKNCQNPGFTLEIFIESVIF